MTEGIIHTPLNRRTLLGALAAAAAVGAVGSVTGAQPATAAATADGDIFDQLRLRYRAQLVGPPDLDLTDPVIAQEAEELAAEMDVFMPTVDRSGGRRGFFTDINVLDATDASRVTDTYKRLLPMATAWAVPGHRWSGHPDLAGAVVEGMRWMNENAYAAGNAEWENWWDWELGSPSRIGKILVIAYDIIPADLRQAYVDAITWYVTPGYMYPRGDSRHKPATGSNLLNICLGAAITAIVGRQADRLEEVRARAPLGLGFNDGTTRDGLYPDGSFIQHDSMAYMGTYGTSFLSAVADVVSLVGGSPWAVDAPGIGELLDGIDAGLLPVVFDGLTMDFVSGREIAYSDRTEATRGAGATFMLVKFAAGAEPDRRERWLRVARGWIVRSAYQDLSNPSTISQVPALLEATAPAVRALPEPAEVVVFPETDRAVHRRPGWAVSLTTASERTARFEVTNSENLRGFHLSAGLLSMYLTGDHDGQRSNGYWPTVDPFRLPGTTVDSVRLPDVAVRSLRPYGFGRTAFSVVGGPLDAGDRQVGRYGAAFSEEQGYQSTMRVNQSWFMIDGGVICLGAGVRGGTAAVETVIENYRVPVGADRP